MKVASGCLQLWGFNPAAQQLTEWWEQVGSRWRGAGRGSALGGGGESLDTEEIAWVCGGCWRGKEGKGIGAGAAKHLHSRWGVRPAAGTYGCRPLTQPGECTLPSEGSADYCCKGNQLSKTAIDGFPLGQTITNGRIGKIAQGDMLTPPEATSDLNYWVQKWSENHFQTMSESHLMSYWFQLLRLLSLEVTAGRDFWALRDLNKERLTD